MKIVFIIGSLSGGGAERVVSEISSCMAEKGNEIYILTIASSKIEYEISNKVKIIDCSQRTAIVGINLIKRLILIRKKLRNISPDVCISFTAIVNIYSIICSIGLKSKLIISERNDPRYDPTKKIMRFLRKILYPFANNYVFQTKGEKDFFSQKIQNKSIIIPNPINPALPGMYYGCRKKRIVMAGRLEIQKNIKMAIDAFEKVHIKYPDYILEIYGRGSLEKELKEYVRKKNLLQVVIFKGNSIQLYDDIKDASVYILSSNYEGISNSMLEALALGIPTVSTDYPSGGAREVIVNYKNGILVPTNDTLAMEKGILDIINNRDLAYKLGKNGYEVRKKFDIRKITSLWIDYIKEVEKT